MEVSTVAFFSDESMITPGFVINYNFLIVSFLSSGMYMYIASCNIGFVHYPVEH